MGCGGGAKATSDTVRETPRPPERLEVAAQPTAKKLPRNHRRKLEPEVLEGFEKIFRKYYETTTTRPKFPDPSDPFYNPPAAYQPPLVTNPFGDLLKTEQSRAQRQEPAQTKGEIGEERRYSPEPPRPEEESEGEERVVEDEAAAAERMAREAQAKADALHLAASKREKEVALAAGRQGRISGMESEASNILSKYQ